MTKRPLEKHQPSLEGLEVLVLGLGRSGVLAAMAFAYSLWAVWGAGAEIVYYGFLLLTAGVPVFVAIKWSRAKAEAPVDILERHSADDVQIDSLPESPPTT